MRDGCGPKMGSISRGTLANGLSNMFAGLVGTLGLTPSTASIGLQAATGVSSRVIGFAIGGFLLALAFLLVDDRLACHDAAPGDERRRCSRPVSS